MSNRFEWDRATPEDQGLSRTELEAMQRALAERDTKSLLVIRRDRVVST